MDAELAVKVKAFSWFRTHVQIGTTRSERVSLDYGVPQGWVFGPGMLRC